MANNTVTLEPGENKPEEKRLTVDITAQHMEMLEGIKERYRSPSIAHTVRLMIEDTARLQREKEGEKAE